MKFLELTDIFSIARTNRYLFACKHNKRDTVRLYRENIQLCQRFYGILNIFEVMLRNAINKHYAELLGDNWIVDQATEGRLLENNIDEVTHAAQAYQKAGNYSSDRMVSSFTFGFWTYLFTRNKYRLGGKTLLRIFPCRATGTTQKTVYNDLTRIREFRNRIAHHEPVIFDASHQVNLSYATEIYSTIRKYIEFMGYDAEYVFSIAERPDKLLNQMDKQRI